MTNSIVDLVNSQRNNNTGIQQIKNLMYQVRNNQTALMQNPVIQNVLNVIRASGMTPQQYA